MRISLILFFFAIWLSACSPTSYQPAAGDILFQDLASAQSQAVKLATGSEYTHCGIVFEVDDRFVVYEAVGPVRAIPLDQWIAQGVDARMVAMRLDTLYRYLTPRALEQMQTVGESHFGKSYDAVFNWSDTQLYCSELVWKIFYEGFGLTLVSPRPLADYDLSHPAVKEKLTERYGDSIPLEEPVVSPGDLAGSKMLFTVYQD